MTELDKQGAAHQREAFEQVLAALGSCSPIHQNILSLPGNATCYPKFMSWGGNDMGGVTDGSIEFSLEGILVHVLLPQKAKPWWKVLGFIAPEELGMSQERGNSITVSLWFLWLKH